MDEVTMVIIQCIMVMLMLNVNYGHAVPSSKWQARGRTLDQCSFFNGTFACNSMQLSTMPNKLPVRTKILMLKDNIMETLDWTALSKLLELEELHLQGNELKRIHWKDIELLPSLRLLDLSDNPIVCDCNMARLVNSDQDRIARLKVRLGETKCAGPSKFVGGRARDVLLGMDCRERRKRSDGESCYEIHCLHGGTCIEKDGEPICFCPSHFTGERCDIPSSSGHGSSSGGVGLSIILEGIGPDYIKISWRTSASYQIDFYQVSIGYDDQSNALSELNVTQKLYSFFGLRPGSRYEVCVRAYTSESEEVTSTCEVYSTHPPPSGPETGPPYPPHHSEGPNKTSGQHKDDEIIQQAAVILGAIIGVCFFFVILLATVYKFHNLRSSRSRQRRTSPTPPENAEAVEAQSNPEPSPDDANNTTSQGHEIIVLAVSSDGQTPEGEVGASSPETGIEIPASGTATIPLNVLQALKQQVPRSQQGSGSANRVVLYHTDNSAGGEQRTTSQENLAGTAPIFIVADGNSFPLDPTLSEVLRNAMSGRLTHQDPLPHDPPPPYSELAEADEANPMPLPDNHNNEPDSNRNTENNSSVNIEDDMATAEL